MYVGRMDDSDRVEAAHELASVLDSTTILIASSDFTHYGKRFYYQPFPSDTRVGDRLRGLDQAVIEAAGTLVPGFFFEELRRTGCTLCGYHPIGMLLDVLHSRHGSEMFQQRLDYQTSGEITGDYEMSVSYAALAYFPTESYAIPLQDQRALVAAAREVLQTIEQTGESGPVSVPYTTSLDRRTGAFVSLHLGSRLLGCVGCRAGQQPLSSTIPELTAIAALDDPRAAGRNWSSPEVEIEISLLTPMKRVQGPEGLRPGEHGGYVESGACRALLLPQVASRLPYSTREGFLRALAHKAGLTAKIYGEPETRLYVFRTHVFGEGN
jgi:hypothetical protein